MKRELTKGLAMKIFLIYLVLVHFGSVELGLIYLFFVIFSKISHLAVQRITQLTNGLISLTKRLNG